MALSIETRRASRREYWRRNKDRLEQGRKQTYSQIQSALSIIKLEAGCSDCGYNNDPVALDFDHVRGKKSFNVGTIARRPIETILEEVEKCDVVCANCHRVRTRERRDA